MQKEMKKKDYILAIAAIAVLMMGVTACGAVDSDASDSNDKTTTIADSSESNSDSNETDTVEKAEESGNIIDGGSNYGISRLLRNVDSDDIYTITFLDSLDDMPEDAWDISKNDDRSVMAWLEEAQNTDEGYYDLYIAGEGGVDAPSYGLRMFSELSNLTQVNFNNNFYTGNATALYMYFEGCTSLQSIDLNSWDVSNVENISYLFEGCISLVEVKIDEWDVSNVVYMTYAFFGCSSLQNIDLKNWDVSNVINLGGMFEFCTSLTSIDLSGWILPIDNEEFVCRGMLYDCTSLVEVKIGNIDTEDETMWNILTEDY